MLRCWLKEEVGKARLFPQVHNSSLKCKHHIHVFILSHRTPPVNHPPSSIKPYMHLKLPTISKLPLITKMSSSTTTPKLNPRSFPRPPLCEPTPRHLRIIWNNTLIAETTSAHWVLETYHPPTYYLPPSALKIPLQKTSRSSYCEWKGQATYYAVTKPGSDSGKGDGEVVRDRIWSYDSPTQGFEEIKGYLSFYAGPWECFVDGGKVEAQPGDFYGGWMTSDIERSSVKGAPGTRGW